MRFLFLFIKSISLVVMSFFTFHIPTVTSCYYVDLLSHPHPPYRPSTTSPPQPSPWPVVTLRPSPEHLTGPPILFLQYGIRRCLLSFLIKFVRYCINTNTQFFWRLSCQVVSTYIVLHQGKGIVYVILRQRICSLQ